jgi:hypothetical protein
MGGRQLADIGAGVQRRSMDVQLMCAWLVCSVWLERAAACTLHMLHALAGDALVHTACSHCCTDSTKCRPGPPAEPLPLLCPARFQEQFADCFARQYSLVHRLETNKLRNLAKFFAHLVATDALPWAVLSVLRLTEQDTTSASRIFIKYLFQVGRLAGAACVRCGAGGSEAVGQSAAKQHLQLCWCAR